MSFKIGVTVIGQHFVDEMAYLNGMEGSIIGQPVQAHVHGREHCYGRNITCQAVAWSDGSTMAKMPVKCLREKRPPTDERDTEWANSLIKKITGPVKELENV